MKHVDLGEPTSLLDPVNLECTQRKCNPNWKNKNVQESKDLLESLISAGTVKQLPGWESSHADTVARSYDMEGHAVLRLGRRREWSNYTKSPHRVWMITISKMKNWRQLDNRQNMWSQNVLKCFFQHASIGRPDIFILKLPGKRYRQIE